MEIPLERWNPFFSLTGLVVAVLAGLLLVAVMAHREKWPAAEAETRLRRAKRSFADYFFVLLISAIFLIPDQGNVFVAAELFVVGAHRTMRLLRQARRQKLNPAQCLKNGAAASEFALPGLCSAGLVVSSALFYFDVNLAPYLVAPIVILFTASASWEAWLLLASDQESAN